MWMARFPDLAPVPENPDPEPNMEEPPMVDLAKLSEPFPREVLGTLNKGGARLTYVPIAEVIVRLNKALGVGNWGTTVVKCERDSQDPDWIVAHVRLSVLFGDRMVPVTYEAFGGQKIKRTKGGEPVDLGDEFKGAVSDALKKAAQQLEVGLELARKEEALRYEERQERAEQEAAANVPADPEDLAYILEGIDSLIDKAKAKFRAWWKEQGLPKPEDLPARHVDAVKAALDDMLVKQAKYLNEHPDEAPATNGQTAPAPQSEAEALVTEAFGSTMDATDLEAPFV